MSICIGTRREPFFDDYLLDKDKTTATLRLGHPVRKDSVFLFDDEYDGDSVIYFCTVKFGDTYRMYYHNCTGADIGGGRAKVRDSICCLESKDGIHFTRPSLGIVEIDGSKDNNCVLLPEMLPERYASDPVMFDNFFVFEDTNPDPAVPYHYKAICSGQNKRGLWFNGYLIWVLYAFGSNDGLHFDYIGEVTDRGAFDSLNTVHWNETHSCYFLYTRDYHERDRSKPPILNHASLIDTEVRDILVSTSPDFIHWSDPVRLDYGDVEDFPIYTNNVIPYYRAPHVLVGTPTRYVEHLDWTKSHDRMIGYEQRRARYNAARRGGTTTTDGQFMCSRDGYHFKRYEEAFFRNDPENGMNWLYGDMYAAYGIIETQSDVPGADSELSFYMPEGHGTMLDNRLVRYTLRLDGFASLHADFGKTVAVTKPIVFEGDTMLLNFATSARGFIYITITDVNSGEELKSYEVFGNKVDRIVDFDGDLSAFAGKEVTVTFEFSDADIYSMKFEKGKEQS